MKPIIEKLSKFFKNVFNENIFLFGITKEFYKEYISLLRNIKNSKDFEELDNYYDDINSLHSFYIKHVDNMFLTAKIGRLYGALNEQAFILKSK